MSARQRKVRFKSWYNVVDLIRWPTKRTDILRVNFLLSLRVNFFGFPSTQSVVVLLFFRTFSVVTTFI